MGLLSRGEEDFKVREGAAIWNENKKETQVGPLFPALSHFNGSVASDCAYCNDYGCEKITGFFSLAASESHA
jgi:hypothetical protein